jgi:hypothetical protein
MQNLIFKLYCFLEVIIVDDDYVDDLMMMNSYTQSDDVIDDECMY